MKKGQNVPNPQPDDDNQEGQPKPPPDGERTQPPPIAPKSGGSTPPPTEPTPPGEPTTPPPDPFDPARLRMDQDFGDKAGVRKLITTIPVRKPGKETFIRTHPDPAYRLQTVVIEMKDDREIYLVDPSLWPALAGETTFTPKLLILAVTRQGVLFLWPIRLPGPDGKIDDWNRSALEAADAARETWVRVSANMPLGAYDILAASGIPAKPEFPDLSMGQILRIAFKDKFIDDPDHPVLRRLRGEL